ncbi:MAG: hypothetical protein O2923_12675 [Verrucomicrobia bacterium]|nr:hypothetical protein [Verrucomicrobiota bacterium]MDA1088289.1 hypothetical protein [Verrucomicrobiota bacterium]
MTQRRIIIGVLIVAAILVAVLIGVPSFLASRNTASRDACIKNLRQIEKMKQADQAAPHFEPVRIVSATSALLPEFRTETTNANKASEDIGASAPNPQR